MQRTLTLILAATLAIVLLGSGWLLPAGHAQTQTPTPTSTPPATAGLANGTLRTISVNGVGRISATPDQAVLRLGVQTEADSAAKALTQNTAQMTTLINALTKANVARADLQTQGLMLFPRYEQPATNSSLPQLVGYTAINTIEVRVRNLNNLGQLLDTAVKAGSNSIESVRFEVSDFSDQQDEAYAAALEDAQRKAEQLAGLAKAQLGQVLTIHELSAQTPFSMLREGMGGGGGIGAQVPVEPGTQSVKVMLQVTWLLR